MENSPALAIFASDKGPGDAERSSIMSQAGSFLARKGARLICPAHSGGLCVPLIKSARAAGGEVLIVAHQDFPIPSALSGVPVERISDPSGLLTRAAAVADALVGLPGSLGSATSLYETWLTVGDSKPVALLNRNRAYEVVRGFAVDVVGHSVKDWERQLMFAESIEDLWNRLTRALAARSAR